MRVVPLVLLVLLSSAVLAGDLELPADQIRAGQSLYVKKCARCHGRTAGGGNAPDIQGVILEDVEDASRGVESMPKIDLKKSEAEQIATYLMSLAPDQARIRLGLD